MLHCFPLALRSFSTMPCHDNPRYNNSIDVYLRGDEIISSGQRTHGPELLITKYLIIFKYGAIMLGDFRAGLEHCVMLFCVLDNIRKTSLFPRDVHRLDVSYIVAGLHGS
ncbi:aspartate--tRNA ligase 2, cytoplasmic [Trifolium repens]|nr:aspartate--tRNA ligase 2, cytoplasmic [Trifolium repens]